MRLECQCQRKEKKNMESTIYRSRKHLILLYPDTECYETCVSRVKDNYDYCYITHDRDLDKQGNIKKPHTHLIIYSKNAIWNTSLSTTLGVDIRFIQKIRNDELTLQYLLHHNEPLKSQYSITEVLGTPSVLKKLENALNNDDLSESEKSLKIIEYIETSNYLTYSELAKYCGINDMWDILRRNSYYFIKLVDEHNQFLYNNIDNFRK